MKPALSREHSKVASERLDVNSKVASALEDGLDGLLVMVVSSATGRATSHEYSAGDWSTRFAVEAATLNACVPVARPEYVTGEVQVFGDSPSREQWNVAPATSAEKLKVASVLAEGFGGPATMDVSIAPGGGACDRPAVLGGSAGLHAVRVHGADGEDVRSARQGR